MATRQTTITLAGMRFDVRVGILPHERKLPQPLLIDLTVHLETTEVLDYRDLYAAVRAVIETGPLEYLEAIGESVLTRVLAMPTVGSARIALRKPHVALGGPLTHAEVVIEGARD